jgi:hypothetical protein
MRWLADDFLKWVDMPWWLRWLICLVLVGIALVVLAAGKFLIWLWAFCGVLVLINVFLTIRDILDVYMPRQR